MSHSSTLPAGPANALPSIVNPSPQQDEMHTLHTAIPESEGNREHKSTKKHQNHNKEESSEGREHLIVSKPSPVVDAKHQSATSFAQLVPDTVRIELSTNTRRMKIDDYDAKSSASEKYLGEDQRQDVNETPSYVPAVASLSPGKSAHSILTRERLSQRHGERDAGIQVNIIEPKIPEEELSISDWAAAACESLNLENAAPSDTSVFEARPDATTVMPASVPTIDSLENDENVKESQDTVVPTVARLPPGGVMPRPAASSMAAPRLRLQVRPGAVRITGPDGPSGDEELGEDFSTVVSSSALLIEATVVEDDEERLKQEVLRLRAERQDAPVAEVIQRRCCDKKMVLSAAILVAGMTIVAVVLSVVLTGGEDRTPTSPATISPSTAQPLFSLIADASPDKGEALSDTSSPQSMALAWLETNANLDSYTDQQKIQRYVLATLYYSTGGDSWHDITGWLSDDNECNWYNQADEGERCINGALVGLDLSDNNLQGTIPREMSMLSNSLGKSLLQMRRSFPFASNSFMGTCQMSCLSSHSLCLAIFFSRHSMRCCLPLTHSTVALALWENSLTGTIPSEITLLTNLGKCWPLYITASSSIHFLILQAHIVDHYMIL